VASMRMHAKFSRFSMRCLLYIYEYSSACTTGDCRLSCSFSSSSKPLNVNVGYFLYGFSHAFSGFPACGWVYKLPGVARPPARKAPGMAQRVLLLSLSPRLLPGLLHPCCQMSWRIWRIILRTKRPKLRPFPMADHIVLDIVSD